MTSHLLVCTCLKAYKTLYEQKSAALNFVCMKTLTKHFVLIIGRHIIIFYVIKLYYKVTVNLLFLQASGCPSHWQHLEKLYILIRIEIDQYGKTYRDNIFFHIAQP